MADVALDGKRVLVREDFNTPLRNGAIADDSRIRAGLPTIREALHRGASIILLSHLGRPSEGAFDERFSLRPVAETLSVLLDHPVKFAQTWIDGVPVTRNSVTLCENVRFLVGEKANDDDLARQMADLCDVFVNDAFATAHRAQASTHGVAKYATIACAGPLLTAELDTLTKATDNPKRPLVAIVGGAKVSSKLAVLEALSAEVDCLIVGGGIANTFLKATGHDVGRSLHEPGMLDTAARLTHSRASVPVPVDVVCGSSFSENTEPTVKKIEEVAADDLIMDLGPRTLKSLCEMIEKAGTVVWNGPIGVFEFDRFSRGTRDLAHAIANTKAFTIAGGGDTLAAIAAFGVADSISYVSTGGGAFLEFLEGKKLPAVQILEERSMA